MRRAGLAWVMVAVMVVLSAGVAVAAVKFGTDDDNSIRGTNDADVLYGKGGSDFIEGLGDDDVLYGGDGDDEIVSFAGDDIYFGGDGDDGLFDGRGNNIFHGGGGNDFFQATAINPDDPGSKDRTPRKKDLVFCGSGRDTAVVDPGRIDFVAPDCEKVFIRTGSGDIRFR